MIVLIINKRFYQSYYKKLDVKHYNYCQCDDSTNVGSL